MPDAFVDLVSHILTPAGFALVSSIVELVPEEEAMIADDDGAEHNYGRDVGPTTECDPPAFHWFGQAILRPGLGW